MWGTSGTRTASLCRKLQQITISIYSHLTQTDYVIKPVRGSLGGDCIIPKPFIDIASSMSFGTLSKKALKPFKLLLF